MSVITARSPGGEVRSYVPVENRHRHHILDVTRAPAAIPTDLAAEAVAMAERIAGLIGEPMAVMDVRRLADHAGAIPLLVVHDRGDRETAHAHSVELAERWSGPATMITTEGLGHRRILTDPLVVDQVVEFVGRAADRSAASERTADRSPVSSAGGRVPGP